MAFITHESPMDPGDPSPHAVFLGLVSVLMARMTYIAIDRVDEIVGLVKALCPVGCAD